MDKGRTEDLKVLARDAKNARDSLQAKKIDEAGRKIALEQRDPYLRDARRALLKKAGRPDETKDIGDQIMAHQERGNSWFITYPKGFKHE